MRGVITMNEEYETRFLCNSSKVRGWERGRGQGQGQERPPAPSATLAGPGGPGWAKLVERELQVTVPQRHVPLGFFRLFRRVRSLNLNGFAGG